MNLNCKLRDDYISSKTGKNKQSVHKLELVISEANTEEGGNNTSSRPAVLTWVPLLS